MLGVAELNGEDVSGQRPAVGHWLDLSPVFAAVGRMIERASCTAGPNVSIIGGESSGKTTLLATGIVCQVLPESNERCTAPS